MTNKEAIEKLERHKMMNCHGCVHPSMVGWCEDHCQLPKAFDMAINALIAQDLNKQVTSKLNFADDTISRQAAIDAISVAQDDLHNAYAVGLIRAKKIISELSPAQPVLTCKGCKYDYYECVQCLNCLRKERDLYEPE